jgi:BMFP domain-containing protein YqiC
MSIALNAKVAVLEHRINTLEQGLGGMTRVELLAYIAQLELRIERIEARKPGPKPKDANG